MPFTPAGQALVAKITGETLMDRYDRECAAAYAKYPKGNIPKDEKRALDALYIDAVNETPETLAVALAANRDAPQTEADRAILYAVKPITEEAGFDGRASVKEAA